MRYLRIWENDNKRCIIHEEYSNWKFSQNPHTIGVSGQGQNARSPAAHCYARHNRWYDTADALCARESGMGILDWFKNRPGQYDPDRASAELIDWAVDKAVTLTNPRLKLLSGYRQRLAPAVATTIAYLRAQATALPPVHPLSAAAWSGDPALRALFVAPR